jgi:hypothetical protein
VAGGLWIAGLSATLDMKEGSKGTRMPPPDEPRASLTLLKDFNKGEPAIEFAVEGLRAKLCALPGFEDVRLTPHGHSTVIASVPARTARDRERLKTLINEKIEGWQAIESQSYSLPKTF